jgi:hypothetical protein
MHPERVPKPRPQLIAKVVRSGALGNRDIYQSSVLAPILGAFMFLD